MSFKNLYSYVKNLGVYPVLIHGPESSSESSGARGIASWIKDFAGIDVLEFYPVEFDPEICRGLFRRFHVHGVVYDADPALHVHVRFDQAANMCEARFICTKELMHVFDAPEEWANTRERYAHLIRSNVAHPSDVTDDPVFRSEKRAMWMARAILCPEPVRQHFKGLFDSGQQSAYDVALALRIPEIEIPNIMGEQYDIELKALLA